MEPHDGPIFGKAHDMLVWLFQVTSGFPKARRHSLTEKIENCALELLECLVRANALRGQERVEALVAADVKLHTLRLLLRLATDLGDLSRRRFGYVSGMLAEMGRLLGGWLAKTREARS